MSKDEDNVKERILAVTIDLIRAERDTDRISMRRIADAAGVAVSMVNYHYQTKANLIERAVQQYVGKVIASSEEIGGAEPAAPNSAIDIMRAHLSGAARFLIENPGVSRVSILRDMHDPRRDDNTSQVAAMVRRQLEEIAAAAGSAEEPPPEYLAVLAAVQVAAIQHLFLRSDVVRDQTGLDFHVPEERERLIDMVVTTTTGGILP